PTSPSTRGRVKLSSIPKPDVSSRCWFHRARHRKNAGRRTWRLVRRLGLLRCHSRELFFAGQFGRRGRQRFSAGRVRFLEIAKDRQHGRTVRRGQNFPIGNLMSLLVVGSIALDTVKTPVEEHGDLLGGSASYAATAASYFSPVNLVGVVGSDFPQAEFDFWKSRKIDSTGVLCVEGKTF